MTKLFLGIDGGGSKTLALIADATGNIIGRGAAESSNYQTIGRDKAFASLTQAVQAAFAQAQMPPQIFFAACIGMAGIDRPADKAVMNEWANENLKNARIKFVNDAELVLAAGTPHGWGIALIAGTGSIVYGCNAAGQRARGGGWGYLLGDEGSGFKIGLRGLQAITRDHDGRDQAPLLKSLILNHLTLASPTDLIKYVYRERVPTTDIAALARFVEEAANAGEAASQAILQEAATHLATTVKAVVSQLALVNPVPCALAGGFILKSEKIQTLFREATESIQLHLSPLTPVAEPAVGAIKLALNFDDKT